MSPVQVTNAATFWSLATATALGISLSIYFLNNYRKKREYHKVAEVSQLFIYPIKSCRGIPVETAECTPLGLRNGIMRDRVFLLITDNGMFVTARQEHKLLLVVPSFEGDTMLVNAPQMETLRISLTKLDTEQIGQPVSCKLWGTGIKGYDCGDEVATWFQRHLGKDNFRLVYYRQDLTPRLGKNSKYSAFFRRNDAAVYADLTPYHFLSESSVDDLNSRLGKPVSVKNFRPNVAVKGCNPYDEDKWKNIKIGEVATFRNVKPCPRCMLTTINPENAIRESNDPLKTLKGFRKTTDPYLKSFDGEAPCFGVGLCIDVTGEIRIGDAVYAA